jgi:hypothetical protein
VIHHSTAGRQLHGTGQQGGQPVLLVERILAGEGYALIF